MSNREKTVSNGVFSKEDPFYPYLFDIVANVPQRSAA
jgi:hypothetical protein